MNFPLLNPRIDIFGNILNDVGRKLFGMNITPSYVILDAK